MEKEKKKEKLLHGKLHGKRSLALRDSDGLTNQQAKSIPIIVVESLKPKGSVYSGVQECERIGVMTIATFYNNWRHQDDYLLALNNALEQARGDARDYQYQRMLPFLDSVIDVVIKKACKGDNTNIKLFLELLGFKIGHANKVDIKLTQQVSEKQASFAERLNDATTERRQCLLDADAQRTGE